MSKKEKEIFTKLNRILKKDEDKKNKEIDEIKKWLEGLKTYDGVGEKVPGLLNNSKLSLETATEDGGYNLILKWISVNLDNFDGFDFEGVPPSVVSGNISIDLSDIKPTNDEAGTNVRSPKKTFKTEEDVRRWINEPETHPITGVKMSPMSSTYADIYEKAYKIMKKNGFRNNRWWYYKNFPKNHRLFGNLDLLFHTFVKDSIIDAATDEDVMHYDLCEFLRRGIDNTEEKDTVLDTEIELIKNRFNIKEISGNLANNFSSILASFNLLFEEMIKNLRGVSVRPIAFKTLKISDITKCQGGSFAQKAIMIIDFMENYKFSNGKIIIDYVREIVNRAPAYLRTVADIPEFNNVINVYDNYKKTYNDYHNLLDPNSGIVNNYEDKKFDIIEDPLDEYFKKYEEKFKKIKSPKFSNLIDLTSFKPVPNDRFLNDKQYKSFQIEKSKIKEDYEKSKDTYTKSLKKFEKDKLTTPTTKSPSPPERPTIKLENGQTYTYGTVEPKHIKDELVKEFSSEYKKVKPLIDNYNKIKDMGYLELIKKETGKYQTEKAKELIKKQPLLSMTRENINDNLLYDYSGDENKCNEPTDILSNEEFDNDNYPVAKLQLMVTLKFTKPNRTECVYAPKLYNLLVTSVNNKEPFINPITRIKYSEEHVNKIMDIMKIVINPDIEKPIFLKPINDTELKINYKPLQTSLDVGAPIWKRTLNWYNISIYRQFGNEIYKIYDLCTIPADIESDNDFATESTDLTSNVMLFRIFKLFRDGRLLCNYVPPYYIIDGPYIKYVKLMIHFNRYKTVHNWLYHDRPLDQWGNPRGPPLPRDKKEFIDLFKSYAAEINNFIY